MRIALPEWLRLGTEQEPSIVERCEPRYMSYGKRAAWSQGAKAVVVIGAFDGLHLGHRMLVDVACKEAATHGLPCVAITFDPDPASRLGIAGHGRGSRLLRCTDRIRGLLSLGADAVISYRFDDVLASTEPTAFVERMLLPVVMPTSVHVGCNFHFGRHGTGDVTLLEELGAHHGFAVHGHELVHRNGEVVSATRVRSLLESASLDEAQQLLARCHYVRGMVEHGRGMGSTFGFPTANVRLESEDCMPGIGVYAGAVLCEGHMWPAAINVGAPPTFTTQDMTVLEANLLGFEGNLYGREVCVLFCAWLRATCKFPSVEELERTVLDNISWVANNIGDCELEVHS